MAISASQWFGSLGASLKSLVKMGLQSRRVTLGRLDPASGDSIVILGNGPSLRQTVDEDSPSLASMPLLAVNFAANTPEFTRLRPRYYVLMDPAFFREGADPNVGRLWENMASLTSWTMTLFVPVRDLVKVPGGVRRAVEVRTFNPVGVEGFRWLRHWAYRRRMAMPRPRNVLIPSLMIAIALGYRNIYVVGADHSWTQTLDVNERNEVVSIQPHYYAEDKKTLDHYAAVYRGVRLHEIMYSFHVAFRAYFDIEAYARSRGVGIINSTPHSFIDAFRRAPLPNP